MKNTITIESLRTLELSTTETSLAIRKIRIAAERGDISPGQAARRLKTIGVFLTQSKPTP